MLQDIFNIRIQSATEEDANERDLLFQNQRPRLTVCTFQYGRDPFCVVHC